MVCGVVGQVSACKTSHFHHRHQHPPSWNDPSNNSVGPAQLPPDQCRRLPLLLTQMGYGLLCGFWVLRRRTNRGICCPPLSTPSTFPWTARSDGCGWWNNRLATQHLSLHLVRLVLHLVLTQMIIMKQLVLAWCRNTHLNHPRCTVFCVLNKLLW